MKPGRNEPCPCGSGKKYKHCHLTADSAPPPDDLVWRRVQRATEGLASPLLHAAMDHFDSAGVHEAWAEFNLWEIDEPFDGNTPYLQVFMPWFLYHWLPDPESTEVPVPARKTTAARAYLHAAGRRLDPIARRFIEACGEAPFSFHEVLACEPGRGFRLRDVFLGTEADVLERSGSKGARAGDLLYARVVPIEGIALLDGCTPVLIPPLNKPQIIGLRKTLAPQNELPGTQLLRDRERDLRGLYLALADVILNPRMPAMANTDGEPLEFHTLVYEVDSVRDTFDALKDLAAGLTEEEILEGAEFDAAGALVSVEVTWRKQGNAIHTSWDNTSLGTLEIEGTRLTAEVNSAARAERLARLIEERLGTRARKRPSMVRSVRSLLDSEPTAEEKNAARAREVENARLSEMPEIQAAMADMLRRHYRAWVDQKIPALGDRTPRKATKDPDGREAVAALVLQMERDGARMQPPLDPAIIRELRETLGLAART